MNYKHLKIALAALVLSAGLPVRGALIHRYSFTSDANDSVGTANGTLMGSATITGNAVVLDGVDSYVWMDPRKVDMAEIAFPSVREALRQYLGQ